MKPRFNMLDPDYAFAYHFTKIQKRFPSLTWDDIIRKGLEEWDKLVQMDEEADREEKARQ